MVAKCLVIIKVLIGHLSVLVYLLSADWRDNKHACEGNFRVFVFTSFLRRLLVVVVVVVMMVLVRTGRD